MAQTETRSCLFRPRLRMSVRTTNSIDGCASCVFLKAMRSKTVCALISTLMSAMPRSSEFWRLARAPRTSEKRGGQGDSPPPRLHDSWVSRIRSCRTGVRGDRRLPRAGEVHSVTVRVEDTRAHCDQGRAHGARILMEPTDFEYGERQYNAEDPLGHQWTFTETLRDIAPEEWGGETVQP